MAQKIPVTSTKIILPRKKTDLLSRSRLLDMLYELIDNKLIIVAAPAGYGKTSLLIDFANQVELPVCWYALDNLDQDHHRFLAHFIASIRLRFPKFGQSSISALENTSQDKLDLDYLITTIVNDAYENIGEHFIIVLDDYHLVDNNEVIDYFIDRFIQDVDENCHLIMSSRVLLTLPNLSLMVARNQVGGLSFEELTFRADEIQKLMLQNYNQYLSDLDANNLAQKTEGWITGLLLSTQTSSGTMGNLMKVARPSGIGLYEYLAQQVLDKQSTEIRKFLLRTSLLEEFNDELCAEVIGKSLPEEDRNWRKKMDEILRQNLFVLPIGEKGSWLRYHHLFRDFLLNRMLEERPDEAFKIRFHLACAHQAHGEWDRAYSLYLQLNKTDEMVSLTEEVGTHILAQGQLVTLTKWLTNLPQDLLESRPALLSLRGTLAVMRNDVSTGLALLNRAIEQLLASPDPQPGLHARMLTRRATGRRLTGDFSNALEDVEQALIFTENVPDMRLTRAEALREKGINLFQRGKINESLPWLNQSLETYRALDEKDNVAILQMELGIVHKALGQFIAAENLYTQVYEYWRSAGNATWQANILNNLGVLKHLLGDYEAATATLDKALHFARVSGYTRLEAFALSSIGDVYRDMDAIEEAQNAYQQARQIARHNNDRFLLFYISLVETSILRAKGKLAEAREFLNASQEIIEGKKSGFEQHLYELESASIKMAESQVEEALPLLEEASDFFTQGGHRLEASRAHFYNAIACAQAGSPENGLAHLKQSFSCISELETRQPLVLMGRETRAYLEELKSLPEFKPFVSELLRNIDRFEKRLPVIRRLLRKHASSVPFAPPKLVIRAFGRMQVKVSNHIVSSTEWQTKAARDLFFLLIAHPEGLSKEAVGAIFWPDASPAELRIRFKNIIYRLRHALGKDAVILIDEYYRFNRSLDYDYDIDNFQNEITQAQRSNSVREKILHYRNALKGYRGIYLPGIDSSWAIAERERHHQAYLEILLKLAEVYMEQKQYDNALDCCRQALTADPCYEAGHRLAMRAHTAMGNKAAVARQYERCRLTLLQEIDASPSPQTQDLYHILMH